MNTPTTVINANPTGLEPFALGEVRTISGVDYVLIRVRPTHMKQTADVVERTSGENVACSTCPVWASHGACRTEVLCGRVSLQVVVTLPIAAELALAGYLQE